MALQTGVATSKVLILVGAGVTGSVILRGGRLSDLICQLQELMKNINDAETSPGKYDAAQLAAQVHQLAREIKELSMSNPITIFNGNSSSGGSYASYILPAAALGAMGYCYMWWKGWSFSDVMFVTKHNMANAVASVSKQLEHVSEALSSTKRHLTKKLENLDWKVDEQRELSKLLVNDVSQVRCNLNQIGYDINLIHEMVSGLEGKIELLESKQDQTNSGLYYLCQVAENIKGGPNDKNIQGPEIKLLEHSGILPSEDTTKGLQFIVRANESNKPQKTKVDTDEPNLTHVPPKNVSTTKMRIHRSYPVGLSFAADYGLVS